MGETGRPPTPGSQNAVPIMSSFLPDNAQRDLLTFCQVEELASPAVDDSRHHVHSGMPDKIQRDRFTFARSINSVARPSRTAFIMNIPK